MIKVKKDSLFGKIILMVSIFFETPYFAAFLAIIELVSYYLALDLLIIGVISMCISFSLLFKEKLNCLLTIFLFMSTMISLKNSPASIDVLGANPNYFFDSAVFVPTIIFAAIPILISFASFIHNFVSKKIEINYLFVSILVLGLAFLINGVFSTLYIFQDTIFGIFLFFFFVVLYFAISPRMSLNFESMLSLSKQITIFSLVIIIELFSFYINVFVSNGDIYPRFSTLALGWGNRNTIGMLLAISLCFSFYLSRNGKNKINKIFGILISFLSFLGIAMSFSRQAYLALALILMAFLMYCLRLSKEKRKHILFFYLFALATVFLIPVIVLFSSGLYKTAFESILNDTRILLWKNSLECFKNNPIFGGGFYSAGGDPVINLNSIMPYCCHDTLIQILGSCGIVGILSYIGYRIVTIKGILANKNIVKFAPILALTVFLLLSLLDIHIFDLFGTAIYVVLLALCLSKNSDVNRLGNNGLQDSDLKDNF